MPRRTPVLAALGLALALAAGAGCRRAELPPTNIYARPSPGQTAELLAQARAGQSGAQRELGLRYYGGDGLPQDPRLAAQWWRQAAEGGDDQAQSALAMLLFTGEGVAQDQVQAAHWWQKAAVAGNADAQATLGWVYFNGAGVPRDRVQGYAWTALAAARGVERARLNLELFARELQRGEEAQAQRLVAFWRTHGAFDDSGARLQKVAEGTVFLVSEDGDAITANHVIADCKQLRLRGRGGVVTVTRTDAKHDLALLRVPGNIEATAVISGDPGAVRQGDAAIVFGHPLNAWLSNGGNLTPGTISALTGLGNDPDQWQITAPVQPGSSGSPVLDERGVVIGVVSMHLSDARLREATGSSGQNLNFAVSGLRLSNFLRLNGVNFRRGGFFRFPRENADIADEARRFTRVLECWR